MSGITTRRKSRPKMEGGDAGIHAKLDLILNKVTTIESDVAILKEDVRILKEDVAILKEDVRILKEDVSGLKIRMDRVENRLDKLESQSRKFEKYIQRDSDIQEYTTTQLIYRILDEKMPTYRFQILNGFKFLYNSSSGKPDAEFDGVIWMTNKPIKNTRNYTNMYYKSAFESLSDTNIDIRDTYATISELIIVEAKHTVNILKIIHKLRKIYNMYKLIQHISLYGTRNQTYHKIFTEMYDKYIKGREIQFIYILFTSDNIDNYIMSFIKKINSGIDSQTYEGVLYDSFRDDTRYDTLIKNKELHYKIRTAISHATTYSELYNVLNTYKDELNIYERYISEYNLPYVMYKDILQYFKDKIGYYEDSTLYFERV
jgi:hypothetical protein